MYGDNSKAMGFSQTTPFGENVVQPVVNIDPRNYQNLKSTKIQGIYIENKNSVLEAVKDLVNLGYPFQKIVEKSGVDEEFLKKCFVFLKLPIVGLKKRKIDANGAKSNYKKQKTIKDKLGSDICLTNLVFEISSDEEDENEKDDNVKKDISKTLEEMRLENMKKMAELKQRISTAQKEKQLKEMNSKNDENKELMKKQIFLKKLEKLRDSSNYKIKAHELEIEDIKKKLECSEKSLMNEKNNLKVYNEKIKSLKNDVENLKNNNNNTNENSTMIENKQVPPPIPQHFNSMKPVTSISPKPVLNTRLLSKNTKKSSNFTPFESFVPSLRANNDSVKTIDYSIPFCPVETASGICNDSECSYQHFKSFK